MLDDDLRALISVDPAPDFRARTLARVEADAALRRARWPLMWSVAVATAAGVALVVALWPVAPSRMPLTRPALDARTVAPLASLPSLVEARPSRIEQTADIARRTSSRALGLQPGVRLTVQIDRSEQEALHRLLTSPPAAWPAPADSDELAIPELTIAPVTFDPLVTGDSTP